MHLKWTLSVCSVALLLALAPAALRAEERPAAARNAERDNERKICAYPQRAVYAGPAGEQNDPTNWVEKTFVCR